LRKIKEKKKNRKPKQVEPTVNKLLYSIMLDIFPTIVIISSFCFI